MPLGLFDDGGQVATSAIFHEDVKDSSVTVNESVMVSHNVFMMEVLEDITSKDIE